MVMVNLGSTDDSRYTGYREITDRDVLDLQCIIYSIIWSRFSILMNYFFKRTVSTINNYPNLSTILYTETCNRKKKKIIKKQREHLNFLFVCLFHGHFLSYYIAGHMLRP